MAKEIKTINVTSADEERTIRTFLAFGWTLRSNQEVYEKDSHNEVWGNRRYSVTETTHFVKLTFERDPAQVKNYQQLRQLENAFYTVPEPRKPKVAKKGTGAILLLCIAVPCLIAMLADFFMGLCFLLGFGALIYLVNRVQKTRLEAWQTAYNKCWAKRERIMAKAEPFLN